MLSRSLLLRCSSRPTRPLETHSCVCVVCVVQLKASLAEQLSVDQLREEFRRYVKTKVAQELVDFYLDSLDREEVKGFFERQVTRQTLRVASLRSVEDDICRGSDVAGFG